MRSRVSSLLGEDDAYLSAQSEEMTYSDTPIAAFISEGLSDVYQQVGNLLGILRDENEEALPAAVGRCRHYFHEYWGQALLESLTALHRIYTSQLQTQDDDKDEPRRVLRGRRRRRKPSSTSASKKRTAVEKAAPQEKERPVRRSSTKPSAFAPVYSYPPSITDEELQSLALARCPAPITIIETREEARRVAMRLRRAGILGIDTETRPSFTAGVRYEVSLLQIATEEECFLFRLNKMGLPKSLISLLEDPAIIKVGLSLRDDITALSRREAFTPGSFVELQKLCGGYGIRELGLQKIYAILFAERMSKSQRMSDWEAKKLSPAQAHYAALDAWASLRIYTTLMALPAPSPTQFALI